MLVWAIHPPASPAIGQICQCGVLCMQVDEQSELEMHVGQDRAAVSDTHIMMPEGACSASNSCWLGRGARRSSSSPIAKAMAFADPSHPMRRFPRAPRPSGLSLRLPESQTILLYRYVLSCAD